MATKKALILPGLAGRMDLGQQAHERYWVKTCTIERHIGALVSVYHCCPVG